MGEIMHHVMSNHFFVTLLTWTIGLVLLPVFILAMWWAMWIAIGLLFACLIPWFYIMGTFAPPLRPFVKWYLEYGMRIPYLYACTKYSDAKYMFEGLPAALHAVIKNTSASNSGSSKTTISSSRY